MSGLNRKEIKPEDNERTTKSRVQGSTDDLTVVEALTSDKWRLVRFANE